MKIRLSSPSNSPALWLSACLLSATSVDVEGGNGSLWKDATSTSLVADVRAHKIGDILTIIVQQSNTATKDNSTKTAKQNSMDASISSFLFGATQDKFLTRGGQYPAMKFDNNSTFNGGGTINNSQNITDKISVRVIEVLPNNNLMIEGHRQTAFSGNSEDAVLRGVVRPDDIQNNSVFSYNVSDATIRFISKGSVTDSTKKGWFSTVMDKINPF
jgi:flagellar L-ring protein precursor FlgH